MKPLTVGSLFSGIGGFDLGFERAGFAVRWQVEIDEFCRRVLAKHWPRVYQHDDVRTFPPSDAIAGEWAVDCIIGGFPCQDISYAGRGEGIDGKRSGLWSEYARIIRVLRPRYVVVENVPALLARGLHRVLGDLATCGYDAEWDCIPAAAVGAPHRRDRVFIVAYPNADSRGFQEYKELDCQEAQDPTNRNTCREHADGLRDPVSNSDRERREERHPARFAGEPGFSGRVFDPSPLASANGDGCDPSWTVEGEQTWPPDFAGSTGECRGTGNWLTEPGVGRVVDGVPDRVHRLKGLGNAVVPQVAEFIGRLLQEFIRRREGR